MASSAPLERLLAELLARGHRGMVLGLDRVRAAVAALGDPQDDVPAIHVAGTNGKGSVCAMTERIHRDAGRRTGLYTSPHLSRYGERIRIDGSPIADDAFESALDRALHATKVDLTFFETLTVAAFLAFREAEVDVAVLEVGLGGRLDATNVVRRPLATAVVSITEGEAGRWLEHADWLGGDVPTIAREKAGIFKAGVPAVVGPLGEAARSAVIDAARTAGAAPVWEVGAAASDAAAPDRPLRLPDGSAVVLRPALPGAHQIQNAAVAAALARIAPEPFRVAVPIVERAVASTSWPGRMEKLVLRGREIWLDCAHNVEGARALAAALDALGITRRSPTLVYGALADKPWPPALATLAPSFRRRIYTSPPGRTAAPLDALAEVADGERIDDPEAALRAAIDDGSDAPVVVTGSLYLVGQLRAVIVGEHPDPAVGL